MVSLESVDGRMNRQILNWCMLVQLGGRLGDSFGVIGSGDSVHVFLSGTGATKVHPFFWDGTSLSKKGASAGQ